MSELVAGEFQQVASRIYLEGLAVDRERNIVWYSDVIAGGIHALMPDGRAPSSIETPTGFGIVRREMAG